MIFIYQKEIFKITKKEFDIIDGNKSDNLYIIDENELKTEISDLDYLINQFSEPVIEENNEFKRFKEKNENSIRVVRNQISQYYQNNNINSLNHYLENFEKISEDYIGEFLNNNLKNFQKISKDYIREFIEKQNTLFEQNIEHLNKYQNENENFKIYELSNKFIFNLLTIDDGSFGYSFCLLNKLNINGNLIPKFLRILENESQKFINDKILNYSKNDIYAFKEIIKFVEDFKETNFDIESASALVENALGK